MAGAGRPRGGLDPKLNFDFEAALSMISPTRDAPGRSKADSAASRRPDSSADAELSAPSTQIAHDSNDYLGETAIDVGRQTRANEHELFVSCNPAPAMQQQFEHLRPEFIAVHDVGTTSSRKLLASIASASGRAAQKLVIRRQGYGTALATIHFVELPSAAGTTLRMYSTDCETEPSWRQSLAHMLLAFSRLGVIMVGDLKAAEIAAVLGRLRDSIARGPWHNEQLLLLPLGSASSLVNHGMELARGTTVNVRTTPQVARATDAWGFISGTWNRLTEKNPPAHGGPVAALAKLVATPGQRPASPSVPVAATSVKPAPVVPPAAPTRLVPATTAPPQPRASVPAEARSALTRVAATVTMPAPAIGSAAFVPTKPAGLSEPEAAVPRPASIHASVSLSQPATADLLRRYVRQISELTGVVACVVFDVANGNRVSYAGSGPNGVDLAAQGAALMSAILKTSSSLTLGQAPPEAAITLESHHLLLRGVPRHHGLALHAVLDKAKANLTLVRLQVLRLDSLFEEPTPTTGS